MCNHLTAMVGHSVCRYARLVDQTLSHNTSFSSVVVDKAEREGSSPSSSVGFSGSGGGTTIGSGSDSGSDSSFVVDRSVSDSSDSSFVSSNLTSFVPVIDEVRVDYTHSITI